MTRRRIVLPGGSGFLGRVLSRWFLDREWDVTVLTRNKANIDEPVRAVSWDGRTRGDWCAELEGVDVVVNLAGRSVDCRYHAKNRRLMMDSRIDSTRVLGEAIADCQQPPRVWMNSSTATIYKHSFDRPMDEATGGIGSTPEAKDEFSVEIATRWEETFYAAHTPDTRKIALRTAMVLADEPGTVFRVLRRLVRLGLGGPMAGGRQYVSWIHAGDFCRAIEWIMGRDDLAGPVNVAAPNPVTNRETMRMFRKVCGVPFGLPASRWMLEVGAFCLRTETELIIKSRRVVPARLLESGFEFSFPELEPALRDLASGRDRTPSTGCDRPPSGTAGPTDADV